MRRATSSRPPKYCHHKATKRAYVTINGKEIYLGPYGSQESKDAYARLLARQGAPEPAGSDAPLTVDQVVAGFWIHAKKVYPAPPVPEKKRPNGELGNYWDALRPLCRLYGSTRAVRFGPLALETVQEEMIHIGWCRNRINRSTSRVKAVFRWAVRRELLPGEVLYRLEAVEDLKVGRTAARESEQVKPVLDAYVQAVLPLVSRQVRAMIELQLLTGMRPGEACAMRTRDIDTADKVWFYRPPKHKTAHHGHLREIRIGPRGQEILAPFLKPDLEAFVFSPADAEAKRAEARRAARKTPVRAWEHRHDRARVAVAGGLKRAPKDRFTVGMVA